MAASSSVEDFGGNVAVVTGAASGIGKATALLLGAAGARVACLDVSPAVDDVANEVNANGGEAFAKNCDVSEEVDVKAAISETLDRFGAIHTLANVAGVGRFFNTTECSLADWNRIISINLTGPFLMCREALPALEETRGSIVNVASVAGIWSHPYAAAYCASKGGVVQLTKALAVEYAARGVRVNALCPSGVMTPIIQNFAAPEGADVELLKRIVPPTHQMSEPGEIARAIAFLAHPNNANMTGSVVVIDGGVTA